MKCALNWSHTLVESYPQKAVDCGSYPRINGPGKTGYPRINGPGFTH